MFTVLFLDQSTDVCGYSIFRNGKLHTYGHYILSEANQAKHIHAHTERRAYLISKLQELIEQYKIDMVIYEGLFSTPNAETYKKLSKVQGSVEDFSFNRNIDFDEFPANEWRSHLPLNPKSKKRSDIKKAVCDYIDKKYPELKNEIEDVKESVALGDAWIIKNNKLLDKA